MNDNMDKDRVAEDFACAFILTFALLSIFVSIGVGFIFGPGAGFLTMGAFVVIFAIALVYGAKLKMKEGK